MSALEQAEFVQRRREFICKMILVTEQLLEKRLGRLEAAIQGNLTDLEKAQDDLLACQKKVHQHLFPTCGENLVEGAARSYFRRVRLQIAGSSGHLKPKPRASGVLPGSSPQGPPVQLDRNQTRSRSRKDLPRKPSVPKFTRHIESSPKPLQARSKTPHLLGSGFPVPALDPVFQTGQSQPEEPSRPPVAVQQASEPSRLESKSSAGYRGLLPHHLFDHQRMLATSETNSDRHRLFPGTPDQSEAVADHSHRSPGQQPSELKSGYTSLNKSEVLSEFHKKQEARLRRLKELESVGVENIMERFAIFSDKQAIPRPRPQPTFESPSPPAHQSIDDSNSNSDYFIPTSKTNSHFKRGAEGEEIHMEELLQTGSVRTGVTFFDEARQNAHSSRPDLEEPARPPTPDHAAHPNPASIRSNRQNDLKQSQKNSSNLASQSKAGLKSAVQMKGNLQSAFGYYQSSLEKFKKRLNDNKENAKAPSSNRREDRSNSKSKEKKPKPLSKPQDAKPLGPHQLNLSKPVFQSQAEQSRLPGKHSQQHQTSKPQNTSLEETFSRDIAGQIPINLLQRVEFMNQRVLEENTLDSAVYDNILKERKPAKPANDRRDSKELPGGELSNKISSSTHNILHEFISSKSHLQDDRQEPAEDLLEKGAPSLAGQADPADPAPQSNKRSHYTPEWDAEAAQPAAAPKLNPSQRTKQEASPAGPDHRDSNNPESSEIATKASKILNRFSQNLDLRGILENMDHILSSK